MSDARSSQPTLDLRLELRRYQTAQRLLRVLVHDLNNHLYAIQGFSELTVPAIPQGGAAGANLQRVLEACEKAREVVELLSDHAHPGTRATAPLDLQRAVPRLIRLLRRSRRAGVTLQVTIDPTVGRLVGRPAELQMLVSSLVEMAELALADNPGAIEVSVRRHPGSGVGAPGESARLAVTYAPLPASEASMDPRAGGGSSPPDPGAECLALIRYLARCLGGRDVVVESNSGGPRVAYVDLPVLSGSAAATASQQAPPPPHGGRVLFVDDERVLVELGREMLEFLGYEPEATTDALQALEWFGRDPSRYACVVTDQTMPGISGDELVRRLKLLAPAVSVIVCTGHSELLTPELAIEQGVRAYLPKPFTISQLREAIQRAVAPGLPPKEK